MLTSLSPANISWLQDHQRAQQERRMKALKSMGLRDDDQAKGLVDALEDDERLAVSEIAQGMSPDAVKARLAAEHLAILTPLSAAREDTMASNIEDCMKKRTGLVSQS